MCHPCLIAVSVCLIIIAGISWVLGLQQAAAVYFKISKTVQICQGYFNFVFYFLPLLEIKSRILYRLVKHSATELYPPVLSFILNVNYTWCKILREFFLELLINLEVSFSTQEHIKIYSVCVCHLYGGLWIQSCYLLHWQVYDLRFHVSTSSNAVTLSFSMLCNTSSNKSFFVGITLSMAKMKERMHDSVMYVYGTKGSSVILQTWSLFEITFKRCGWFSNEAT